ncbi:hypothetical protein KIF53_20015 [Chromobacterium subtsugae]|uniref:Uncharacterized protein n=1 Tax=Chromobacterium subtsugae TaxID=251747 RepID=A0ABS7FKS6_9NEIS|nr:MULTISPECIES: hypothetical protein [Chromobacterium]MBW7566560.1 hypothetical protein [Chromobacterium subtsugae]MBW8289929.1 hypothetical protein [Chromobacterium subtsugae]WSE92141.1 hypothetical protein U6115_02540 [Chromobacterium subtsugae]WVH60515.1 hypothetical protein U6151_02540 [Chromobacterium subtsugae]
MNNYKANMAFEDQIRSLADAYWKLSPGTCKPEIFTLENGKSVEIDAVVRTRDLTVLICATTSSKKDKISEDVNRLCKVKSIEQRRDSQKDILMKVITRDKIDALQITHCRKNEVQCLTKNDFLKKFFDAGKYISLRENYPFGSVEDPKDGNFHLDDEYVQIPLFLTREDGKEERIYLSNIVDSLMRGELFVIEAPFGAGKSLTCKEIFKRISRKYHNQEISTCPMVINLRDHWGQDDEEILTKHARQIGYANHDELMIGFRAGMCLPLIDGFDEIGVVGIAKIDDKNFMRQARINSLSGVKSLISKIPLGVGMLIVGRDHYFDGRKELESSLGLVGKKYHHIRIGEFGETEIKHLLKGRIEFDSLPDWIPKKPLFLTYLIKQELLSDALGIADGTDWGSAWCKLIDYIAIREASISKIAIEKDAVLNVLAELSLEVRRTPSGTGPITPHILVEVLTRVTGQAPTNQALVSLQKLPGLTTRGGDASEREFLDSDMLYALQGICLHNHILSNTYPNSAKGWIKGLDKRSVATACHKLRESAISTETVISIMRDKTGLEQFCADLFQIVVSLTSDTGGVANFHNFEIEDSIIETLSLEEVKIENIAFKNVQINKMELDLEMIGNGVSFDGCLISKVIGISGLHEIPRPTFSTNTIIDEFQNIPTNAAIVAAENIPNERKAILTILKKVYSQSGGGRKINALKRGVPQSLHKDIDNAIKKMERSNLIRVGNIIYPIRSNSDRARTILQNPFTSKDEVFD